MLWHRTIRCTAVSLLTLWAGMWVGSYGRGIIGGYTHADTCWFFGVVRGTVYAGRGEKLASDRGWAFYQIKLRRDQLFIMDSPRAHSCLGFSWGREPPRSTGDSWCFGGIPCWYVTLMVAVASVLMWRKTTRPTAGFPVEMQDSQGKVL